MSFIVLNEMHALYEIIIIIYSLKRYWVIFGGFTLSYVAHVTLIINKKGGRTFRLASALIYAYVIA